MCCMTADNLKCIVLPLYLCSFEVVVYEQIGFFHLYHLVKCLSTWGLIERMKILSVNVIILLSVS